MSYKIYDKKKKKYPFTDDAPYSTEKSAKQDIVGVICVAFDEGDYNKAIYFLDNYVVKKVPVQKAPVKKGVGKKSPAPKKVFGRPKK